MKFSNKVLMKYKIFGSLSDKTTKVGVAINLQFVKLRYVYIDWYRRYQSSTKHRARSIFEICWKIYMFSQFDNFNYSINILHQYFLKVHKMISLIMSYFHYSNRWLKISLSSSSGILKFFPVFCLKKSHSIYAPHRHMPWKIRYMLGI